jgi:N-acetylglucosamine kinase-like BadF-type ATPase
VPLSNRKKTYIGIDGGGSKTTCILCDEHGEILAIHSGSGTNMKSKCWPEVKNVLFELIKGVLDASQTTWDDIQCVFMSLAGSDRTTDRDRIISSFPMKEKVIVRNDAYAALASGTFGKTGTVLIAGTGSIAYFISPDSKTEIRIGGWGYLLGDEGSGFSIGQKALNAVLKAFDGRGEKTALTSMVLEKFNISHPTDIIDAVYENEDPRKRIAELSHIVLDASQKGDPVALQIKDEAIRHLLELIACLHKRTNGLSLQFPIVITGGLFSDSFFRETFLQELKKMDDNQQVIFPQFPPALGACVLAMNYSGIHFSESIKKSLCFSWHQLGEGQA